MSDSMLKVEVTESGPCERTMNVTVQPDAVKSEREKVIAGIRKEARVKGFRPGKAPRNLIEKTYAGSIREELVQKIVSENFQKALEQEKIAPLNQPQVEKVELDDDYRLSFQARFEVSPEIKLNRYKKFKIKKRVHKVTDKDVDSAIENLREQYANFIPKDGTADKGDYLLLDFSVLDEQGNTSPEGRRTNQLLMAGHEDPYALFSHALVGKGEGENQTIVIDFPEDYPDESLKAQKVTYLVDIKGVRQKSLPEVDDHFAKQVSQAEDLTALRAMIRENLEREINQRADRQVEEDLFRQIIEANSFDIPSSLVEATIRRQIENIRRQGRAVDENQMAELIRPSAEFAVKREYVIGEIIRREEISVTDEDINAKIEEFAAQLDKTAEEVRRDFRSREAMNHLRSMISVEKVVQFLLKNNDIKQVKE
ncbi:MAG: trigger factor [Deltaproteobacteria bacterium]|nr:trigger factor [Deltaproteobacteria bacterium]